MKANKRDNQKKGFNPEGNSMILYMREISRYPLLSKEEEESLARQAATGDVAARDKLVKANLRFVISIAQKYRGQGLPLEDLISEGNIGLLTAVKRFDIEKGYRFITYAVWWIRQSISKAVGDKGRMIRLPLSKKGELAKIGKKPEIIPGKTAASVDNEVERIARLLNIPAEKAKILMQVKSDVLSLEDPIPNVYDDSVSRIETIADECNKSPIETIQDDVLKQELEKIIDGLETRSAEIIRGRYGLGNTGVKTLQELGERFNLSRERVRQIEKRALGKILQSPRLAVLKSFIA